MFISAALNYLNALFKKIMDKYSHYLINSLLHTLQIIYSYFVHFLSFIISLLCAQVSYIVLYNVIYTVLVEVQGIVPEIKTKIKTKLKTWFVFD